MSFHRVIGVIGVIGVIAIALLLGIPAGAIALDRRIAVSPGGLLQVDLDLGEEARADRVSLEIRSHDADEVYAVADFSGLGDSSVTFRVEESEGGVRLYGRSGGLMSWLLGGPGVAVRVWVPREFSVDARNVSGPLRIEDLVGTVRARTREGRIEIQAIEGEVRVHTQSGSVHATEIQGPVVVRTRESDVELSWITGEAHVRSTSGDIRARHIEGPFEVRIDAGEIAARDLRGRADVKTEQGAVYASFAGPAEGRIETQRGSVEVSLPAHVGADLDARTRHGTVKVLDGLKVNGTRALDQFVGAVNGGGPSLQIYTARGNIRVGRH